MKKMIALILIIVFMCSNAMALNRLSTPGERTKKIEEKQKVLKDKQWKIDTQISIKNLIKRIEKLEEIDRN